MNELWTKIRDIIYADIDDIYDRKIDEMTFCIKKANEIFKLFPQWTEKDLPKEKGLYLIMWPNGGIDALCKKEALRHLKNFKSLKWMGPLPEPTKERI